MSISYGTYVFPKGFACVDETDGREIPLVKLPRADGAVALTGTRKEAKLTVRGTLNSAPPIKNVTGTVQAELDSMLAALHGGKQHFFLDNSGSGRYLRTAQVGSIARSWVRYGQILALSMDVQDECPFWHGQTPATTGAIALPSQSCTLTPNNNQGSAYALARITFTFASTGAVSVSYSNTTSGLSMSLNGTIPATTVIVDCDPAGAGVVSNSADATFLWDGELDEFVPGSNSVILTATGVALNSIKWDWTPRYFNA